ncbi:MAG: hypothetical protein JNM68_15080, partial [Dinghuibacter sp.]|nr:hypothetical protein [Dinghuibacter sp.]
QPIIESDLVLDESLTNPNPPAIDLSTAQNADEMQQIYDNGGGNNPKEDKFIYLVPDNEKKYWIGYDEFTYVQKDTTSASRMGKDDLLPVNPIDNANPGSGSGAVGIKRVSRTDNFSFSVGAGPLGGSFSTGTTKFLYEFTDMNGDRYPDILSTSKIQYTHPYGGLENAVKSFSFGDVLKSDHLSAGFTLGGTFLRSGASSSRATPKGAKAARAGSQSEISAGVSGNFNYNEDKTAFAWMDINGDGLPDRVYKSGEVELNIGYSFLPKEQWGYTGVSEGIAYSYGAGLSINISNHSIAAGIGLSRTESETNKTLQDMNGDGLLDFIAGVSPLRVAINTGNGFAPPVEWTGANALIQGVSTGESANAAFTIGIPIIPILPVVKLCINPSVHVQQGSERTRVLFEDIDGDDVVDYLQSASDNAITVARSRIERTNKLKKVNRPMGAYFTLNYTRVGNTYALPNSIWALSEVEVYDGVPGNGADRMFTSFAYENGRYNRHERDFYGFEKVIRYEHDTENGNIVYRSTEQVYRNDNFYEKGLPVSETVKDAAGNKFTETINTYVLKHILTGATLPASIKQSDDGMAFPALVSVEKRFYEGGSVAAKSTSIQYTYDVLGNLTSYTDFGEPGNADDVTTTITYHSLPAPYLVNIPASVTVSSNGEIYRQRSSVIDNSTGNVTELKMFVQSGAAAAYSMAYDVYGNITQLTRPQNATGQRLTYTYEYDSEVQTYPTFITDTYGYSSRSVYDVRFGQLLLQTDRNGQETKFAIDNAGRLTSITGPLELASGQPFTVAFEYYPNAAVPWALSKRFDPANPANLLESVLFTDGLGRELQTKKDIALFTGRNTPNQELMRVSGHVHYDAFGRSVAEYYPTTEPKGSTGVLNTIADTVNPTRVSYDVLNRVLATTLPDMAVSTTEYGFGADREGDVQFRTRHTDANGIVKEQFTDVHGHVEATKEQYSQGTDVWTSFHYNPVHEMTETEDDLGNITLFRYDRLGRQVEIKHPDAGTTIIKYDLVGNITEKITANLQGSGTGIKYTYDFERPSKVIYPLNPQNNVTLSYGAAGATFNRAGRLVKQQDATGSQ